MAEGHPSRGERTSKPGRSRITLADVAAEAGVSVGAAGFVLSGRDDMRISTATQERVRAAALKLKYRPNRAAQALRTGKTGTIGFVSDEISSTPFAGAAVRGALEVARERQKTLYIAETLGDPVMEHDLVESLRARDVDGFVFASMVTREVSVPSAVGNVPAVLMNAVAPGTSRTAFVPDDRQGGFDAARALLDAGHREFAVLGDLVSPLARPLALDARLDGIRAALEDAGLKMPVPLPLHGTSEPALGREAMAAHLRDHPLPDALVALNDRLAFGALQALGDRVRPGVDFSVVSFDNSDLAQWLVPALATLQLPYYEMGRRAMTSLLDGELDSGVHALSMSLVRRDSIRPRSAHALVVPPTNAP